MNHPKSPRLSLLATVATLLLTTSGASWGFNTSGFFPLRDNEIWTYQVNSSYLLSRTILPGTTLVNGVPTKALQDTDGFVVYLTNDGNGIREHQEYDPFPPASTLIFSPPLVYAAADATVGLPVLSSGTATAVISGLGTFPLSYTATATPQAFESVTVPAGTFYAVRNLTVVQITGDILGTPIDETYTLTQWFAERVGSVREIDYDGLSTDIYELSSWTKGSPTFADVSRSHFAFRFVEGLYAAGITSGCTASNYCPATAVTRGQMAVFLERGMKGSAYTPPACQGTVFGDVTAANPFCAWIEQLAADGITSGCGGGNYCPATSVTRGQMAVFLLRAKYGSTYSPPGCIGTTFADVGPTHPFCAWIEQLATEGITSGCGGGNYCPGTAVNRAQMAIFLQRTFNLPMPL